MTKEKSKTIPCLFCYKATDHSIEPYYLLKPMRRQKIVKWRPSTCKFSWYIAYNFAPTKLNSNQIFYTQTIGGRAFHLNLTCLTGGVPL